MSAHDHGEVYIGVASSAIVYRTFETGGGKPVLKNEDEIRKRKVIGLSIKGAWPEYPQGEVTCQEAQFHVVGIKPGRQEITWYDNSSLFSQWFASWQKLTVVVSDTQLAVIFPPGRRFPNGSPEYLFFCAAFEVIEQAGVPGTAGMYETFRNLVQMATTNGRVEWDIIPGLFPNETTTPGYFNAMRRVGVLLRDAARRGAPLERIRQLESMARRIQTGRATELQHIIDEEPAQAVIDSHTGALSHWQGFVALIVWIIAEGATEGGAGPPPKF